MSTSLNYEDISTPRPGAYFQASVSKAQVLSQGYKGKSELDIRLNKL